MRLIPTHPCRSTHSGKAQSDSLGGRRARMTLMGSAEACAQTIWRRLGCGVLLARHEKRKLLCRFSLTPRFWRLPPT